jgi:hypothetical protein
MMPLYQNLVELVFDCRYLQADESTMQFLEDASKGKSYRSIKKEHLLQLTNLLSSLNIVADLKAA